MWIPSLVVIALLACTAEARKNVTITWQDCGTTANHAKITNLTWSPVNPQPGDNVTITGYGTLNEVVSRSTASIELAGGLVKKTFDSCKGTRVNAPFDLAILYFPPQNCPMRQGPLVVSTRRSGSHNTHTTLMNLFVDFIFLLCALVFCSSRGCSNQSRYWICTLENNISFDIVSLFCAFSQFFWFVSPAF